MGSFLRPLYLSIRALLPKRFWSSSTTCYPAKHLLAPQTSCRAHLSAPISTFSTVTPSPFYSPVRLRLVPQLACQCPPLSPASCASSSWEFCPFYFLAGSTG